MGYSPERKAAVLKRMLPSKNLPVRRLSQEEGISEATLHKWRAQARCNTESTGVPTPDHLRYQVFGTMTASGIVSILAFVNLKDVNFDG